MTKIHKKLEFFYRPSKKNSKNFAQIPEITRNFAQNSLKLFFKRPRSGLGFCVVPQQFAEPDAEAEAAFAQTFFRSRARSTRVATHQRRPPHVPRSTCNATERRLFARASVSPKRRFRDAAGTQVTGPAVFRRLPPAASRFRRAVRVRAIAPRPRATGQPTTVFLFFFFFKILNIFCAINRVFRKVLIV